MVFDFDSHNLLFSFVLVALILLALNAERGVVQYGLKAIVCFWGMRLALYLFLRILRSGGTKGSTGGERTPFGSPLFRGFQAVSIWIVLMPVTVVMSRQGPPSFRDTSGERSFRAPGHPRVMRAL